MLYQLISYPYGQVIFPDSTNLSGPPIKRALKYEGHKGYSSSVPQKTAIFPNLGEPLLLDSLVKLIFARLRCRLQRTTTRQRNSTRAQLIGGVIITDNLWMIAAPEPLNYLLMVDG